MDIKEFGNAIIRELENDFTEEYELKYNEVLKNNGVIYHAITIRKENLKVAPTIYIDGFFDKYENGMALSAIAKSIARFYNECSCHEALDVEFFNSYAEVSEMLSFRLVSFEPNRKRLENVPYRRFEDLALVPVCAMDFDNCGQGTITISKRHLELWEISEEELWDDIMENAGKLFPPKITPISDIINDGRYHQEDLAELDVIKVLSNEERLYGANVVLYPGFLKQVAQKADSDLYIIPSSVHEVLAFPVKGCELPIPYMTYMVKEVNLTTVSKEEVLSFELYYYDKDQDKLSICG